MVVEYEKDYLEELYITGKCTNKKYRFQKPVAPSRHHDRD